LSGRRPSRRMSRILNRQPPGSASCSSSSRPCGTRSRS
jgi:hypothetical protein